MSGLTPDQRMEVITLIVDAIGNGCGMPTYAQRWLRQLVTKIDAAVEAEEASRARDKRAVEAIFDASLGVRPQEPLTATAHRRADGPFRRTCFLLLIVAGAVLFGRIQGGRRA